MSVRLYLPDRLRYSLAKGKGLFEVNGETVGECLDQIVSLVPGMAKALFYHMEKKALHAYVNVALNKKRVGADALATKVKDGDAIHITMRRN